MCPIEKLLQTLQRRDGMHCSREGARRGGGGVLSQVGSSSQK